jgi:hypothetical protein
MDGLLACPRFGDDRPSFLASFIVIFVGPHQVVYVLAQLFLEVIGGAWFGFCIDIGD